AEQGRSRLHQRTRTVENITVRAGTGRGGASGTHVDGELPVAIGDGRGERADAGGQRAHFDHPRLRLVLEDVRRARHGDEPVVQADGAAAVAGDELRADLERLADARLDNVVEGVVLGIV